MRSVAGLIVIALAACSFGLAGPREPATVSESCDPKSIAPTLDAVGTVAFLALAGAVFYKDLSDTHSQVRGPASLIVGAPSLVIGIVYGVSALGGFDKVARCRSARAQLARTHPPAEDLPERR